MGFFNAWVGKMKERHVFNLGVCPFCGSGKIKVTTVTKPRRRYKCHICSKNWGCLEIVEMDGWLAGVLDLLLSQGRLSEYDFKTRRHIMSICKLLNTHM